MRFADRPARIAPSDRECEPRGGTYQSGAKPLRERVSTSRTGINEIFAIAPQAFRTFAPAGLSGLLVLIACFARLGSRVIVVEKNLVGLRDEMRAEFA